MFVVNLECRRTESLIFAVMKSWRDSRPGNFPHALHSPLAPRLVSLWTYAQHATLLPPDVKASLQGREIKVELAVICRNERQGSVQRQPGLKGPSRPY